MKYKTQYPTCYDEGARNVSVRISEVAYVLLAENDIDNTSAFVNDLIIDALQEKDYFKRRMMASIQKQVADMKNKYGMKLRVAYDDDEAVDRILNQEAIK